MHVQREAQDVEVAADHQARIVRLRARPRGARHVQPRGVAAAGAATGSPGGGGSAPKAARACRTWHDSGMMDLISSQILFETRWDGW